MRIGYYTCKTTSNYSRDSPAPARAMRPKRHQPWPARLRPPRAAPRRPASRRPDAELGARTGGLRPERCRLLVDHPKHILQPAISRCTSHLPRSGLTTLCHYIFLILLSSSLFLIGNWYSDTIKYIKWNTTIIVQVRGLGNIWIFFFATMRIFEPWKHKPH